MYIRWVLSLLVVTLTLPALANADEPTRADIARLIKQLGSDKFAEREAASKKLAEIGEPALEPLRKVADSDDVEVRRRVRELIKAIEVAPFVVRADTEILGMALSSDGSRLVTISADISLRLWDAHTGQQLHLYIGHTERINSVAISPDGRLVLSGGGHYQGQDFALRLWSLEPDKGKELKGHTAEVTRVAFLPGGKQAVSASCDKTIRLWDLESAKEIRRFEGHRLSVRDIAVSADGKQMISGSSDRTLRLWDVTAGKELRRFEGHEDAVECVAFAPDGKHVLSSGSDGALHLWDTASGKEIQSFTGHTRKVRSMAFAPDGRQIASGGDDRTVRLWDVAGGKQLRLWNRHTAAVTAVLFTPDGRRVFSASLDHHVRQWPLAK